MEFVNSLTSLLAFANPWESFIPELNFLGKIVQAMYNWIGNYGWTVVVFTVFLKILTLPLDIWQKISMKKSSVKMAQMQPLLDNIDKQYANDQRRANEEKQKLFKKQGYSAFSSCLPLIVTMVVFIVMFSGLNSYSAHINVKNYSDLYNQYTTSYNESISEGNNQQQAISDAKEAVGKYYTENIQESFLWIKNVWRPDTWVSIMADANTFKNGGQGNVKLDSSAPFDEGVYNAIYQAVVASNHGYFASVNADGTLQTNNKGVLKSGWNGLLILPVCAMGLAFLSSFISKKQTQTKTKDGEENKQDPNAQSQKMMMYIMPLMLGVFGFLYTAAFAIYMVANSLLSILTNLALDGWVNRLAQKSLSKNNAVEEKASYKR